MSFFCSKHLGIESVTFRANLYPKNLIFSHFTSVSDLIFPKNVLKTVLKREQFKGCSCNLDVPVQMSRLLNHSSTDRNKREGLCFIMPALMHWILMRQKIYWCQCYQSRIYEYIFPFQRFLYLKFFLYQILHYLHETTI